MFWRSGVRRVFMCTYPDWSSSNLHVQIARAQDPVHTSHRRIVHENFGALGSGAEEGTSTSMTAATLCTTSSAPCAALPAFAWAADTVWLSTWARASLSIWKALTESSAFALPL